MIKINCKYSIWNDVAYSRKMKPKNALFMMTRMRVELQNSQRYMYYAYMFVQI